MQTQSVSIVTRRRPQARLLPRIQSVEEFADLLAGDHPAQFQPGDIIDFEKDDGRHTVTILGLVGETAHLLFYNGMPYHVTVPASLLDGLRVVSIRRMDAFDLAMYRAQLGEEARQ